MAVEQQYYEVQGMDFTLPAAPPLLDAPLSLLTEAPLLVNLEGMIDRKQHLVEKAASAAEQLPDDIEDIANNQADSLQDTDLDLYQQMMEWNSEIASLESALSELQQWEHGFVYLPELGISAVTLFTEDSFPAISNPEQGALKQIGPNQNLFGWNDPFLAIGLDSRSGFGWPGTSWMDRIARASRALKAHEAWQVEREYWTGAQVPTNVHLTASPNSVQTSPHRSLRFAFDNPTPPPGTTLGVAESLSDSLASLDQAIASADAGQGMIHASPYIVQKWTQVYPYMQDKRTGNILTVNGNLIVPGYGYPGTGPDQASRSVSDGVLTEGDNTLTSATADFTTFDIGTPVVADGVPEGTVIYAITSDTVAVMNNAATSDETDLDVTLTGSGGDNTGNDLQWAYATDLQYHLQGDIITVPFNLREQSPALPQTNLIEARAERSHSIIGNNLLRAAVLVDSTQL